MFEPQSIFFSINNNNIYSIEMNDKNTRNQLLLTIMIKSNHNILFSSFFPVQQSSALSSIGISI